jgi:butyryl-CoA dehydrogenase
MSDATGVAGLGSIVIDKDAPGLKFGSKFKMMGSRPVPRSEVIFDDCIVPVRNILTGPGSFRQIIEVFNCERIHNACLGLGIAQGAYEHAAAYARKRIQFNKRLVDFQGIRWKLAEMETLLEACRCLVYKAAWAKDAGKPLGALVSQAKLFAATYCPKVCDEALQIEGAFGYSEGSRVERAYRDVRLVPIGGGTTEMMKNFLGGRYAR